MRRRRRRRAGPGEGKAKMAGPARAFGPQLGRAAGSTAAWERGRLPWSSQAAAGKRGPRGGVSAPLPLRTSEPLPPRFLSASPAPAAAEHPLPIDLKFTFFGVHAPSAPRFFLVLVVKKFGGNNGIGGGACMAKHSQPFFCRVIVLIFKMLGDVWGPGWLSR